MRSTGLGQSPDDATELSKRWRPWRSYALMHLWSTLDLHCTTPTTGELTCGHSSTHPPDPIRVIAHHGAVTAIEFTGAPPEDATPRSSMRVAAERAAGRPVGDRVDDDPLLMEAARQLTAYFDRDLKEFDLPLRPEGTPFQQRVWEELQRIGYGQTATYGELAERLGMTRGASRAVGAANGRNPIGIVIPCHRVVGAEGLAQRLRRRGGAQAAAPPARAGLAVLDRAGRSARGSKETHMWTIVDSPVGPLRIVAQRGAIIAIDFDGTSPPPGRPDGDRVDDDALLTEARTQLEAFFDKQRHDFDLPLRPAGTDFQQRVWEQLLTIPYGETVSYGEIAGRLGMTGHGSRAVGLANGRNPIPIVIPCHRVVGADGSLTGYGGGVDRKIALLDLETAALF